MGKSSTSFTSETAPRKGGKPGRKAQTTILRTNAELLAAKNLITPLEVLQGIAGDPTINVAQRKAAADAAAPYVHRRMPQVVEFRKLSDMTLEELEAWVATNKQQQAVTDSQK